METIASTQHKRKDEREQHEAVNLRDHDIQIPRKRKQVAKTVRNEKYKRPDFLLRLL